MKKIKFFKAIVLAFLLILTFAACQATTNNPSTSAFVGSVNSDIYHYTSCEWAQKIHSSNLVRFSSVSDAKSHGYRACRVCSPPQN